MTQRERIEALEAEVARLRAEKDELVDQFLKAMIASGPVVQYVPYVPYVPPVQVWPVQPWQPSYPWITYCGGDLGEVSGTICSDLSAPAWSAALPASGPLVS